MVTIGPIKSTIVKKNDRFNWRLIAGVELGGFFGSADLIFCRPSQKIRSGVKRKKNIDFRGTGKVGSSPWGLKVTRRRFVSKVTPAT